jgi:hypothetical protein
VYDLIRKPNFGVNYFENGFAEAGKNGKRGWIDKKGNWYDIHPEGKSFEVNAKDLYDKMRREKPSE